MKKNKLLSSYVKKGTQPMKSPNLVSLSSSDNINNITFGDLDILDANSTKLVAGQSGSGISYEDIEGHLFESFISKNIVSAHVQTDNIAIKDEGTGKLSIRNANNIALEILRTSANSKVYMPLLGYTSNLNYTSLHACGGVFVGDQNFSAVENKYYPELSLHTHSGAWTHHIFSRSNMYRLSYAHKNNSNLSCTITIDTDGTIGGDAKIANQQSVTYEELYNMRSNLKLIPGRFYRIVDYVTTTMQKDTRSAGHQFDVIVRADSNSTLSETAWAAKHSGDTYFQNAKLEAWQLKYRLDNVQWSKQVGTYVADEDNGYTFLVIGDITLQGHTYKLLQGFGMYVDDWGDYALMETVAEGEHIIYYSGNPEEFNPEESDVVGTASSIKDVAESGKGTITWMKDEHGNECPYDFKNVQFKRYMATDSVSGRDGLGGKYMVADLYNCPRGLSVEDEEDFIWAYTFSSDNSGGEQTDYSLIAEHQVHDNVFRPYSGGLPNNVMFGEYNYSNSFGFDCYNNSWGNSCYNNSWGNECYGNSWGNSCYNNSWGNNNRYNSWGNECYGNSWGNSCYNNSWGNKVKQSTLFDGVQYTQITTENVKNVQVLNGVAGMPPSKLTLTFAANKTYTQVAAMTTAGQLKIWNPADRV